MAELQSKSETAPAPAPVVAEVPSNDAVAKKASETGESKAIVSVSESEFLHSTCSCPCFHSLMIVFEG